jgi:hypothetical protein
MNSVAADIATALGGRPNGSGYLCPCPLPDHGQGRGDRRPSLSVADGDEALVVHCFGGCDPIDLLEELRRRRLLDEREPFLRRPQPPRRPALAPIHPDPKAIAIWHEAREPGEAVTAYLRSRAITLPIPPTIRQGVGLVLARTPTPSMVAALQAPDRRVIAVQQLRLTWAGRKVPITLPRLTTGKMHDGAVRLGPNGDVLGLAEGIETALSAMQLSGVPVWAALGAERMSLVRIPEIVRELHVFLDNDDPGRRASEKTAERWLRHGVTIKLRAPPEGVADWNDYLQARARALA